jgi:hypothetical protein
MLPVLFSVISSHKEGPCRPFFCTTFYFNQVESHKLLLANVGTSDTTLV